MSSGFRFTDLEPNANLQVGRHDVFVSIYESSSWDDSRAYLNGFAETLDNLGVEHRIISKDDEPKPSWPYGTAPERIDFLSACRNKVLEPLQSPDPSIRLKDWTTYGKIVFLNDIRFRWQDIVSLIRTRLEDKEGEDYDLACAIDFAYPGK